MIYLIMFVLSCLIISIGETKKQYKWLIAFGLALPILLATMRAETVGSDILGYVKPTFLNAKIASNLGDFFRYNSQSLKTRDLEYGFLILSFFAVKLSGGLWGMFFVYEFIMIISIYYGVKEYNLYIADPKYKVKIWQAMFVFYTLFYNMSLTMIKQSLACCLVFASVMFFINRKYMKMTICLIVAVGFHTTAIIGLPILAMYFVLIGKKIMLQRVILIVGLIFFALGGRGYWVVMNFMSRFINISGRYLSYSYMWEQGNGANIAWLFLIIIAAATTAVLNKKNKTQINQYLFYMSLWSVFLYPLSVASSNAGRVEYYFIYFMMISLPLLKPAFEKIKFGYRMISKYLVILIGLVYWVGTTGLNDYTGTMPYVFAFLQ